LLHHRFPASDIPKQARDLYTTNWLRLIPDVNYKPSRLVPQQNPITNKPLDLSNSVLRSVSPVHLEYMRNMGQGASMSVSLLKGKNLWGLISCHNPEPKFLRYNTRIACEFIGQIVSAQIITREESAEIEHRITLKGIYDELLRKGGSYAEVAFALQNNASKLLALTDAQGAALCFAGQVILCGKTPSELEVRALYKWFIERNETMYLTDALPNDYPASAAYQEVATGLLAISLQPADDAGILWFRPEMREEVPWGGNPNLAKTATTDGKIHPRSSFATWMQVVSGKSKKWTQGEISIVDELRTAIVGMALRAPVGDRGIPGLQHFRTSLANSIATTAASLAPRVDSEAIESSTVLRQSFVESTQNSRMMLEGFAEFAVLLLDLNGVIQNWSSGAQRLFGYVQSQALGHSLNLFFSEEDVLMKRHLQTLDHVKTNGRSEDELWLYRQNRTSFWGKIMLSQVRDSSNSLLGYSAIIQDITKERAAEEELKATKLAAESANVAKTAFLANISHEIRTPLGAVLGFSELMAQPGQTETERAELFKRVRRNGDQLTALINELLDLAKVESGRLEIERIEFNLKELLFDLEQTFSIKAAEKSLRFEVLIDGEVPLMAVSDPTRLRQILTNLLSNAIKFTSEMGKVKLCCSVEKLGRDTKLLFRVEDSGRGMNEQEMSRLFQPFAQADVSTTRKYGGTGLGLFVSQRLARALNGDLNIEKSEIGVGTTFLAQIDAGRSDSTETFRVVDAKKAASKRSLQLSTALAGSLVLVVDDSPDNRHLIQLYLQQAGAKVETAENGAEGVERALKGKFDIVLMDIQMPVMDGNLAVQSLRSQHYEKPVVALTAHAMQEERERSLAAGFTDYVTKPIDRELLISVIANLVKKG
jgi:PAS domain S-box-containing protein